MQVICRSSMTDARVCDCFYSDKEAELEKARYRDLIRAEVNDLTSHLLATIRQRPLIEVRGWGGVATRI